MTVEELNAELTQFITAYNKGYTNKDKLQDLKTRADKLFNDIQAYFAQNSVVRYRALGKSAYNDNQQIDTMYLYQQELQLQTQVKQFQEILNVQLERLRVANDRRGTIGGKLKSIETKIEEIDDKIKPQNASGGVRDFINQNVTTLVQSKKDKLDAKKKKLERDQAKLEAELATIKPFLENNSMILTKQQKNLDSAKLNPKPVNYEEMHLLNSIHRIFGLDLNGIQNIQALQTPMRETILALEQKSPMDDETQKRFDAMKELLAYYEGYVQITDEPMALTLPDNYQVKAITYDLPLQYHLEGTAQTKASIGTSVEVPRNQMLSVPKKALMRLEFENGGKLWVIPDTKPKLFLPSHLSFPQVDLDSSRFPKAYTASIKMFAEQYLKMTPDALVNPIELTFKGLGDEEQGHVKKVFVETLIEQEAVKKSGNNYYFDVKAFQNICRVTKNMLPETDPIWGDIFKKYDVKGHTTWQNIHQAFGTRTGAELSSQQKLMSSKDYKKYLGIAKEKSGVMDKAKDASDLLDKAMELFEKQLSENPDIDVLKGKALSQEKWEQSEEERKATRDDLVARRAARANTPRNTMETLGDVAGDALTNMQLGAKWAWDASIGCQSLSDSHSNFSWSEESPIKYARAIQILTAYGCVEDSKKVRPGQQEAHALLTKLFSDKYQKDNVETELHDFIKARQIEQKKAESTRQFIPKK